MMNNNMNGNFNFKLSAGDKIKLVAPIGPLGEDFVGDVYEITKYENGLYYFECPYGCGCFTPNEFDKHFEIANDEEHEQYDECKDVWNDMVQAYHEMMNKMGGCEDDDASCGCHCCNHHDIPNSDGGLYMDENGDFEFEVDDSIPEYIENILECSEIECSTMFDCCAVVSCKLPNGYILVEHSAISNPEDYDYATEVKVCMDKIVNKLMGLEAYRDMWDCMMADDADVEEEIDIEKLQKSVRELEKQRVIEDIDNKIADLYKKKINDMRTNFCMNPWYNN